MKIALFLHQPKCSIESGNGILQALQPYHSFKIFTRWHLDADFFDDVDMIAVPGGIGDADSFDHLLAHNGDVKVQKSSFEYHRLTCVPITEQWLLRWALWPLMRA